MASSAQTTFVVLNSLRGGMNDEDPINMLQEDEAVLMQNVELFYSALGERRAGSEAFIDLNTTAVPADNEVVHLSQWFPTNDVTAPELWAISHNPGTSTYVARRSGSTWFAVTPVDAISTDQPEIYQIQTQTQGGKQFFAYKSAQNRLHVWDGTTLRRAGIAEPGAAPTAANTAAGGTFTGTRYYRVRFVVMSGSDVLVRSEPSAVLTFNPSGTNSGVDVTRPATTAGEPGTHWELEASDDGPNADFYRIARTIMATTVATDTNALDTYPSVGVLSEDIGEYLTLPAAKFLAADGDRILFGGNFTDPAADSTVGWTPVANDDGSGNNERLPLAVDNTADLDPYEGGGLTGISQVANGSWYAFKWSQIYQLVRTGDATRAYEVVTISKIRGALPGSIVSGIDEQGAACIYFIDPITGPSRIGRNGLQRIKGIRGTYGRTNLTASDVVSHGVYYPNKRQVHWWIATEGADRPNKKIVLQVNLIRERDGEICGGWTIAIGRIAEAICSAILNELVQDGELITLFERPIIGKRAPEYIMRCDTGEDDGGFPYQAIIRTRPYLLAGLLNNWGGMAGALLATAHPTAEINVKFIRDFGLEENLIDTTLEATGDEEYVIRRFDHLRMSESASIQFEFADPLSILTI